MERDTSRFSRLKLAKRPAINFSGTEMVRTSTFEPRQTLPLVVEPAIKDIDLAGWAAANRDFIEDNLSRHGALLFRGFGVNAVSEFEKFADAACDNLFGEYGDLPREKESERVYGSTPYPEEMTILFHNESSHMHRWPTRQFFYCAQPSDAGGETPIVDCRRIYDAIPEQIIEEFERKGLVYVRNFTEGLDISWQDFFKTDDPERVAAYCRSVGLEYEWKPDGLRTRQHRPAITRHPKSGEKVFFNQIQLHHTSCLAPQVREALLSMFTLDNLPRSVYFGDGSHIDDSVVRLITDIYWQNAAVFLWQKGDLLMLDNMLVAHGRKPFVGTRKIVVAMGDMITESDL